MKRIAFLLLALVAGFAQARPVVVEHSVTLTNPDRTNWPYFGRQVAIDGDYALVLGERVNTPPEAVDPERHRIVWVYHREGEAWNFVGPLAPEEVIDSGDGFTPAVAMRNGIVATLLQELRVYRLVAGSFVRQNVVRTPPLSDLNGPDLEIDGNRILVAANGCSWDAVVFEQDTAGTWRTSSTVRGNGPGCGDSLTGGPLDLSGDNAVLFNSETFDPDNLPPHAKTYRTLSGAGWLPNVEIAAPPGATQFGPEVALRGSRLFVAGSNQSGTYVFDLSGANPAAPVARLQPVDSYAGGGVAFAIEKSPGLVLQRSLRGDRYENHAINAFQQRSDGSYAHAAMLVGRQGQFFRGRIDVSGRDVIAASSGLLEEFTQVFIWRLPASFTTPAVRQDNFESGSGATWTQTAGSQFAVVQRGPTRVFRQSNAAIDARALLSSSDWTTQAIEADITITSPPQAQDRGVGLFTRYQNPQNYFQAVFTTRGIWLSRMGSGRLTQVGLSPDFPVTVGRTYRLRFESTHAWQRVYVDGQIVIDTIQRGPTHGSVGLVTETSTAEFDNVLVTPSPRTPIYSSDFTSADTTAWSVSGPGIWTVRTGVFAQSSVAGDARALIGTPTDDQVVRATAQLGAFGSGGTADKWFGVAARASNTANYYYLSLRSSNTLQLRKLVNGAITLLASTPFPVTRGRPYALQLEAVGTQLRARVDGALQFEVSDTSHASGQPGLVAYRAAVDYDDFVAVQP